MILKLRSQLLRTSIRSHAPRSRASVMLEFALILPIAIAIMLFSVDMGRLALMSTGLHDAAAVGARAGARQGYVGTATSGPTADAFNEAANVVPGLKPSVTSLVISNPTTSYPGVRSGRWCSKSDNYVRVTTKADVQFITPGIGSLLGLFSNTGKGLPNSVQLSATGVARCEVTR